MIEVFTRPSCPHCTVLKNTLSNRSIAFVERVLDLDITREELLARFPDVKYLPILAVGKHRIAGADELQALIANDALKHLI